MYSFQSKSDWIIVIPLRGKARLFIYFRIKFNRNESPSETRGCYLRTQNAFDAVARKKCPMYSFQSKTDWIIFIPRRVKARLYI
jgi:hypothetical protein